MVRGTTTFADRGAEIVSGGTPKEDQEDGAESWNAGCYDDDVHLDAAS